MCPAIPKSNNSVSLTIAQRHFVICYCYARGNRGANLADNADRVSKKVEAADDLVQLPQESTDVVTLKSFRKLRVRETCRRFSRTGENGRRATEIHNGGESGGAH